MKLKKGDKVTIVRGRDKGKTGKIEKVLPKVGRVVVEGANIYKKHVKSQQGKKGGIIEVVKPLSAFQVMLVCPTCSKSSRIGYQFTGGKKERICKKCGAILDKKVNK